jgi:hypothetical protein
MRWCKADCRETNLQPATQEIPYLSQDIKIHCHFHKNPLLNSILSQPNPVNTQLSNFYIAHLRLVFQEVVSLQIFELKLLGIFDCSHLCSCLVHLIFPHLIILIRTDKGCKLPITWAAWSRAWTVFAAWTLGLLVWIPLKVWMSMRVYSVFVLSCV